jgi:hypothetical protein
VQVAVQLELAHAEAVRPNMRVNLGEAPLDAVSFLRQLPDWGLCMKELSLLAREGRNSPATGSARFQPSHVVWFGRRRLNDSNSI